VHIMGLTSTSFDFPSRVLRQFGFLQDVPDLTAPYFAPRPLTGRVAGRVVEAWIGRTSLETESLPRYDDPEATPSYQAWLKTKIPPEARDPVAKKRKRKDLEDALEGSRITSRMFEIECETMNSLLAAKDAEIERLRATIQRYPFSHLHFLSDSCPYCILS